MRTAKNPLNKHLYWKDAPETVDPKDYIQRMVDADPNPAGDARKRALSNLRYAKLAGWVQSAPMPHPQGHVLTEGFYRWLLYKYPKIRLPERLIVIVSVCDKVMIRDNLEGDVFHPYIPTDPMEFPRLQVENQRLQRRIEELEAALTQCKQEITAWEERNARRREKCGRRPTEK